MTRFRTIVKSFLFMAERNSSIISFSLMADGDSVEKKYFPRVKTNSPPTFADKEN